MSMPPPKRDSKSGRWRFRKAVPLDLREKVGKLEIVRWLGTDAKVAREENARLHVEWEKRFTDLRQGVLTLSPRDAAVLAGRWYRWFTARWENEGVTSPHGWLHSLERLEELTAAATIRETPEDDDDVGTEVTTLTPEEIRSGLSKRVAAFLHDRGQVSEFLLDAGVTLDAAGQAAFLHVMRAEFYAAHRLLARRAGRDFGPDEHLDKLPPADPVVPRDAGKGEPSITGLASAYYEARQVLGQSKEAELRWRPVVTSLVTFLKHDVASRVTTHDLIRWRDELLKVHSPKTVRDSDVAAIKTIFGWGVENLLVPSNPAKGVKVRMPAKTTTRDKGFTDKEALGILRAALDYVPGERESEQTTAAKRWTPWLCAFTGARIGEMTQLRKEDVQTEGGIAFIGITPEAGSVKTGQFRHVPLHPQLVEMGFLEFVRRSPEGPLFFPATRQGGKRHPAKAVSTLLAKWIGGLGVVEKGVAPNHGWRHRFKTVARDVGIDFETREALQGHSLTTAGQRYGTISLAVKKRAIDKLPRYDTAVKPREDAGDAEAPPGEE